MKTEAEIRKHLADLEAGIKKPCGCRRDGHAYECMIGGYMAQAGVAVLRWVLDHNPDYDRVAEEFAAGARR